MARENLAEALRRVEQNAGAAGIDGMSTKELRPWLKDHWPEVRSQLDAGTYRPQPVRRVMIPKPSGGLRMLGVPAAVDRLICQAIAQVLTPVFDPHFHPIASAFGRGARSITLSSGHASSSLMTRRGALTLISTRFWCHRHTANAFMGAVSKRAVSTGGTSIRRPFRRPLRTWMACSSPRLTRCNTVWRETPRVRMASTIGT
jgi:hypothetical protein